MCKICTSCESPHSIPRSPLLRYTNQAGGSLRFCKIFVSGFFSDESRICKDFAPAGFIKIFVSQNLWSKSRIFTDGCEELIFYFSKFNIFKGISRRQFLHHRTASSHLRKNSRFHLKIWGFEDFAKSVPHCPTGFSRFCRENPGNKDLSPHPPTKLPKSL